MKEWQDLNRRNKRIRDRIKGTIIRSRVRTKI